MNAYPFIMFDGRAKAAIEFYQQAVPGFILSSLQLYDKEDPQLEGLVQEAHIKIGTLEFKVIDSPVKHQFGITPAISLFLEIEESETLEKVYEALREKGQTFMELGTYGFSDLYAWVQDEFGLSWQLNLQKDQVAAQAEDQG